MVSLAHPPGPVAVAPTSVGVVHDLGIGIAPLADTRTESLVRSFATAEEMSTHQEQRELAEALRVQAMTPPERWEWLGANWDPLQEQTRSFYRGLKPSNVRARCRSSTCEATSFTISLPVIFLARASATRRRSVSSISMPSSASRVTASAQSSECLLT